MVLVFNPPVDLFAPKSILKLEDNLRKLLVETVDCTCTSDCTEMNLSSFKMGHVEICCPKYAPPRMETADCIKLDVDHNNNNNHVEACVFSFAVRDRTDLPISIYGRCTCRYIIFV
jgi:hypothetical protein